MTTQSDREKAQKFAEKYWNKSFAEESYLTGAEAKDLEWQAKVQGLVDALENAKKDLNDLDTILMCDHKIVLSGFSRARLDIQKSLAQLTSGQPAKGVMVPEWKVVDLIEIILGVDQFESTTDERKIWLNKEQVRIHCEKFIKGIGRDL